VDDYVSSDVIQQERSQHGMFRDTIPKSDLCLTMHHQCKWTNSPATYLTPNT